VPSSSSSVNCPGSDSLTATTTPITISDGPTNYASNANCRWTFRSTSTITVQITQMDTESAYDFVTVYDGDGSSGVQLGRFSGSEGSGTAISSSGTSLTVVLTSDTSVEQSGFEAIVSSSGGSASPPTAPLPPAAPVPSVPAPASPATAVPVASVPSSSSSVNCPGSDSLTATTTPITISDGPANYASNANCRWTFSASSTISVRITAILVESGYDFVTVYDGGTTAAPQLGRFTGSEGIGTTLTSTGASIVIEFVSDSSQQSLGFQAAVSVNDGSYTVPVPPTALPPPFLPTTPSSASSLTCPGSNSLTAFSIGTTISDGSGNYASNSNCQWIFSANSPITVRITDIQTESNYDFVTVYDGPNTGSAQLGKFSGSQGRGTTLTSSGTSLTITLVSDNSVEAPGFEAFVTTK